MKLRRAAAPYAKALFARARERDQAELVGRELGAVAAILDEAMLGGFIVETGSVVVDGSFEGQLDRTRRRLASG